jgi:four helix bundle protein
VKRNTKFQTPNPKQTSNTNLQSTPLVDGWHYSSWTRFGPEPSVLKDGPPTDLPGDRPARHPFDLEERTALFGERVVRFAKSIPRGPVNNRLIDQLVGAGTSVGGNFCEANDCESKKDFRHILKRCLKEAKETRHFLRMVAASEPALAPEARELYREATELLKIFSTMHRK